MTFFRACLIALLAAAVAPPAGADRADDSERKSKNGKTEAVIDGITVTLEFGRPQVRDRKIWGELVPFDKVWRTGADEATTITFSAPVLIQGEALDAGIYSLFTIPGEGKWTVIFNRQADQWGAYKYDSSQDALRILVIPRGADHVEAMNFEIEGSEVSLRWAELALPFAVTAP
ncbi:MAG: DUF2911 domain-containing protein [Acidobacteriota bacterium]